MNIYKKILVPENKRLFFVGDLHGAYDLYEKGCKELGITQNDIVISLGDLIDRGKKNFKCVMEFTQKENRYAIKGNHEDLMIKGMVEGNRDYFGCWMLNGGDTTWDELGGENGSMALAYILQGLPVTLEVEHKGKIYACVHAGIPHFNRKESSWQDVVNKALVDIDYQTELMWDRSVIDEEKYHTRNGVSPEKYIPNVDGVDFVFHGHTVIEKPIVINNRVYMDTGGFFNSKLTFAWCEDSKLNFYTTGDYDDV